MIAGKEADAGHPGFACQLFDGPFGDFTGNPLLIQAKSGQQCSIAGNVDESGNSL